VPSPARFSSALRRGSSALVGWLADRGVPRPLRGLVYGGYCRCTGAEAGEAELGLADYPSLGAFFVRRLKAGARSIDTTPGVLVAPCDGRVQALGRIERGTLLQAKGRAYALEELLGGPVPGLEGAWTATIYLSPRDYHRVHAPLASSLTEVRWIPGERRSVAPSVLERRERVLATNERAALGLACEVGRAWLVMVGALNVGRIRVLGVEPGRAPGQRLEFARGAELARFEMGSTVVLVVPRAEPVPGLAPGAAVRLGQRLATFP
jgi:phosphatidylserine decarboxylase